MSFIATLKKWVKSRRRRPVQDLLAVEFDDKQIRVCVLADLELGWNQTFLWSDITRVCFKDGGPWSSDIVYVSLSDREKVAEVPIEARDGHKFFGELCSRGFFPENVWRKAMGDTSGGLHCWPPFEK